MNINRSIILTFFAFQAFAVSANLYIDESTQELSLTTNLLYLTEGHKQLIPTRLPLEQSPNWKINHSAYPNFGFTKETYWFKQSFSTGHISEKSWLITIPSTLLGRIDLYVYQNGFLAKRFSAGTELPFHDRPINHRKFTFPITLNAFQSFEIYIRVKSTDALLVPITLKRTKNFTSESDRKNLLLGLALGGLLVMTLYNLFLFITTRHKEYLYYTFFVSGVVFFEAVQYGLGFQYLWPNSPGFNLYAVPISIIWTISLSLIFVSKFLSLKKNNFQLHKLYQTLTAVMLFFLPLSFFLPAQLTIQLCAALATISWLVILISSTIIWRAGVDYAKFIVFGWGCLIVTAAILTLSRFSVIPSNTFTEGAPLIGAIVEALAASFGLGNRINQERKARFIAQRLALRHELKARQAQEELLQQEKESKKQLERQVEERTMELSNALEELNKLNRSLQNASYRDPLTGLYNRRYLQENYGHLVERAKNNNSNIAVLFLDLDHFKEINDKHGHLIGDLCLTLIANDLKNINEDGKRYSFRYGGEEFIVIAFSNSKNELMEFANALRIAIHKQAVPNTKGHLSVSIGISSLRRPGIDSLLDEMIEEADQALYCAKEAGRNRVVEYNSEINLLK